MKKIVFLIVVILASLVSVSAPVKGMVAARNAGASESAEGWKNPYITDGLVAMWDGEWNVGPGKHDENALVWVDISGEGHTLTNVTYGGNGWVEGKARRLDCIARYSEKPFADSDIKTVSVCCRNLKRIRNSYTIIDFGTATKKITVYGTKNCFICTRAISYSPKVDPDNVNSFTIVYSADKPDTYFRNLGWFGDVPAEEYVREWASSDSLVRLCDYRGVCTGVLYNVRIYNRALSQEEITFNWEIDKARFNLE